MNKPWKETQLYDGLHGIYTSLDKAKAIDILGHYGGLWRIEQSFRVLKSEHEIRPIYHHEPRRVRAHIAICFMAFTLMRVLKYKINKKSTHNYSDNQIMTALRKVQVSVIQDRKNGSQFLLPSHRSDLQEIIYKELDLHLPETANSIHEKYGV